MVAQLREEILIMARYLLCAKCGPETVNLARQYGEFSGSTKGKAINEFLCDHCGQAFEAGSEAHAVSCMPQGRTDEIDRDWEREYVAP